MTIWNGEIFVMCLLYGKETKEEKEEKMFWVHNIIKKKLFSKNFICFIWNYSNKNKTLLALSDDLRRV